METSNEPKHPQSYLHPAILQAHRERDEQNFKTYVSQKPHIGLMLSIIAALFIFSFIAILFLSSSLQQTPRTQNSTQIYPVPTSIPPHESNGSTSTKNWKTYIDTKYKWSIQYPDELTLTPTGAGRVYGPISISEIDLIKKGPTQKEGTEPYDGLYITIGTVRRNQIITLKEFADLETKPPRVGSRNFFKEVNVNGLQGYQALTQGEGSQLNILLPYRQTVDKAIWITAISEGTDKPHYDQILNQILSTFRFTD